MRAAQTQTQTINIDAINRASFRAAIERRRNAWTNWNYAPNAATEAELKAAEWSLRAAIERNRLQDTERR